MLPPLTCNNINYYEHIDHKYILCVLTYINYELNNNLLQSFIIKMNPMQKAYDSYDKNNMLLKTVENKYHHQNLALIRNRKNKYNAPAKSIHTRKPDLSMYIYVNISFSKAI